MKIRFTEYHPGFPAVEIMPDGGDFNGIDGRITVKFFDHDLDTGKRKFSPRVSPNVSFHGDMFPAHAGRWGDCFKAAEQIALHSTPADLEHAEKEEIEKAFTRVDELLSALKS